MLFATIKITALVATVILPLFRGKKEGAVKYPKNYRDTSGSRYAVNEQGLLEEIKLPNGFSNQE